MIGKNKVICRYDPIISNHEISVKDVLSRIEYIGDRINDFTEKLVFSI